MDDHLETICELAGVSAAMVFDDAGRLVAHRSKAVYDRPLCEQVCVVLARAIDSIALQQPDWESATALYADGTVLLRNVGPVLGASYVMAVVADSSLNSAFATVALRVATAKTRRSIELGHGLTPSASSSAGLGSSVGALPQAGGSQALGAAPHPASGSRPLLATSGVSWSQVGGSGVSSKIMSADPGSASYLARCAKTLALHVGPMARIFVEEAVRRVSPDAPFSMARARPLAEEVGKQIDDAKERSAFLKAMETSGVGAAAEPSKTLTTYANRSAVLFRPSVYQEEILPAYQVFVGSREKVLLRELVERARPLAATARSGLGPNLIIRSELDDALKKLKSEAISFGDLDLLAKGLVTGLVDLLCVPWERGGVPVQRTWGSALAEYLEPRSTWIADHLLRGVPLGAEVKLPSGAALRFCEPAEVERLREELLLVPRPPGPEAAQREYDTLLAMLDTINLSPDLKLALWSR